MGMPDRESLGGPAACEPPFVAELRRLGVGVVEETYVYGDKLAGTGLLRRIRRVLGTARRLRRRLRAESFDVVHLNTSFDTRALLRDVVTVLFLRSTGGAIFLKFHGSDGALLRTRNPLLRVCARALLRRARGIGVLSSEEKANFARAGVDESKLFVVKNVVERDDLTRGVSAGDAPRDDAPPAAAVNALRGRALAARFDLKPGVPLLLFIARFIPAKGLLDVIRACREVRDRGHEFALLCVGDGPARAAAEAEAERLDMQEVVRFCGFIPEEQTGEFYAGSTMLVFPTYHYEGFPMVVFYSVAAGLPVVTTRIRAAADYLREPDNCLWVEARSPAMLAEKIAHLLEHPDARDAMRRNNLALARRFTAAAVAPEYVRIYNQLAGLDRVEPPAHGSS